jgi:histidinol-phosphate aminotransferase
LNRLATKINSRLLSQMQPIPRQPLRSPELTRPDWQAAVPRSECALWLDKNENLDPGLLSFTSSVWRELDPLMLATYPECGLLYRKLAAWVDVPPAALILTPGSDGAIRLVFEAFVAEGDTVIHSVPTFAMYPVYCQMFGARAHPLCYERGAVGPQLDTEWILREIAEQRPRLFCLPNPDSPTGTAKTADELRQIIEACGRTGTVALIDEAYHPFHVESCALWTQQMPQLVVARTFAKAWGLAGLRIGYAVGHPQTIAYLHKLRPMYEVSTVAVTMMERMLDHVEQMEDSVKRLNDGKRWFAGQMEALGFNVLPTQGNFQHVAFGPCADVIHRALDGMVLYRKEFNDECLKGYSRFSATTAEKFAPIVEAIRATVTDSVKGSQ